MVTTYNMNRGGLVKRKAATWKCPTCGTRKSPVSSLMEATRRLLYRARAGLTTAEAVEAVRATLAAVAAEGVTPGPEATPGPPVRGDGVDWDAVLKSAVPPVRAVALAEVAGVGTDAYAVHRASEALRAAGWEQRRVSREDRGRVWWPPPG